MISALVLLLAAGPTVVAPGVVSTERNEYNLTSSADGATVVFARSDAEFRNAKVHLVARDGSTPTLPFSDPAVSDTDPQIAPDGLSIVFVSDRPLPERLDKRDLNVWRVRRDGEGWSAPEPVPVVNSPGYELGPEFHDGALYFNSTRQGGPGRLDVWRAAQTPDGFAEPQVLPGPINSPSSEGDFTLSPDGRAALFWSDRPGGLGAGRPVPVCPPGRELGRAGQPRPRGQQRGVRLHPELQPGREDPDLRQHPPAGRGRPAGRRLCDRGRGRPRPQGRARPLTIRTAAAAQGSWTATTRPPRVWTRFIRATPSPAAWGRARPITNQEPSGRLANRNAPFASQRVVRTKAE